MFVTVFIAFILVAVVSMVFIVFTLGDKEYRVEQACLAVSIFLALFFAGITAKHSHQRDVELAAVDSWRVAGRLFVVNAVGEEKQ